MPESSLYLDSLRGEQKSGLPEVTPPAGQAVPQGKPNRKCCVIIPGGREKGKGRKKRKKKGRERDKEIGPFGPPSST